MAQKMAMTGAISVVAPGSPIQIMFGVLVMIFYLLAALKAAPYTSSMSDWITVLTTLAIVITNIFALVLMSISSAGGHDDASTVAAIDSVLVGMNLTVLVIQLSAMASSTRVGSQVFHRKRSMESVSKRTKVEPAVATSDNAKERGPEGLNRSDGLNSIKIWS